MKPHRAVRRPSQIAHFRVDFAGVSVPLHSISRLHDLLDGEADPELRMAVTLRRAVTDDRTLYDWYRDTTLGKKTIVPVTIELLDGADGDVVNRFGLENARPVRWSGPLFDAQQSAVAMEEVEVRYDAVRWLDL